MKQILRFFALLAPTLASHLGAFTTEQQNTIVAQHNDARGDISERSGGASDMYEVSWDASMAAIAQTYSDTCPDGHSGNKDDDGNSMGENIYWNSATSDTSYTLGTTSWYNEYKLISNPEDYSDALNQYDGNWGSIGHYTQLCWHNTILIGCGQAHCPGGFGNFFPQGTYVFICNYSPSGNYQTNGGGWQKVFSKGTPCSECDAGDDCNNGFCVKGDPAPTNPPTPTQPPAACDASVELTFPGWGSAQGTFLNDGTDPSGLPFYLRTTPYPDGDNGDRDLWIYNLWGAYWALSLNLGASDGLFAYTQDGAQNAVDIAGPWNGWPDGNQISTKQGPQCDPDGGNREGVQPDENGEPPEETALEFAVNDPVPQEDPSGEDGGDGGDNEASGTQTTTFSSLCILGLILLTIVRL